MTKEAKLSAAMRILPEWKGYDDEIRELQKKIDSGLLDDDPAAIEKGKFFVINCLFRALNDYCNCWFLN